MNHKCPIHHSSSAFKILFVLLSITFVVTSCKKKVDDFEFSGTAVGGGYFCTQDGSFPRFSYPIVLTKPDGVGVDFTFNGVTYHNVVRLYNTNMAIKDGEKVSGRMYMDDEYDQAYCTLHNLNEAVNKLPQAVCSSLD